MNAQQGTVDVVVNLDTPGPVISRHIYGHFAEHLGRCIYEGFWVGEDSEIDNVDGIRSDVVTALRGSAFPICAGLVAASLMNTTGWTVSARVRNGHAWSTRIGVTWWRTTTLAPMSS